MKDNDTLIRDRLADAATFEVVTDARRVRDGVARRRRGIRRRRRGAAALCVLVVAGVGGAGLAVAWDRGPHHDVTVQAADGTAPKTSDVPSSSQVPDAVGMPHFPVADGWDVRQVGIEATASTNPLASYAGNDPWDAVQELGADDVVLYVAAYPKGESVLQDANTPPGVLPLSLDDMPSGGMEGHPGVGLTLRRTVQVNGWNLDLMVFFGRADPSAKTRALAQDELTRLDVPVRSSTGG